MVKKFTLDMAVSGRVLACLNQIKKLKLEGKTIVDIGSSFGWLEKELLTIEKSIKIIGVEPDPTAVDFSNKNIKDAKFLVGDALNLPVKDKYADIATFFDVIEHVPKNTESRALMEVNRILKPKGLLFLSTPNSNFFMNLLDPAYYFGHRHYKLEKLKRFLKDNGFKIIKSTIKGGFWFSFYLIWLYITKRITGNFLPRNLFLEKKEAAEFTNNEIGLHTHFIVAQKI
ncbi:MAG: class I SAM-dependent methyltransferase [Patescibacteria group bacterium]